MFTLMRTWFGDQARADREELVGLHKEVELLFNRSLYSKVDALERVNSILADEVSKASDLPNLSALLEALDDCQKGILILEASIFEFPAIDWGSVQLSLKEEVELRERLLKQKRFLANPEPYLDLLGTVLVGIFSGMIEELPNIADAGADAAMTAPLAGLMHDPRSVVARVVGTFFRDEFANSWLFSDLRCQLYRNICEASGVSIDDNSGNIVGPGDSKLQALDLVHVYLKNTPFEALFMLPVPIFAGGAKSLDNIDVFISYSKFDTEIARMLAGVLEANGINVWWDMNLEAGNKYRDVILAALESAKAVIVIWSDASVVSSFVRDEADHAASQNKLVPVHVPSFRPANIPLGFRQVQSESIQDLPRVLNALRSYNIG